MKFILATYSLIHIQRCFNYIPSTFFIPSEIAVVKENTRNTGSRGASRFRFVFHNRDTGCQYHSFYAS